jgi:hypothetical protein
VAEADVDMSGGVTLGLGVRFSRSVVEGSMR